MRIQSILPLLLVLLTACATQSRQEQTASPEGLNVVLVVARDVRQGYGPIGVGDRFPIEGRITAYASLSWTDVSQSWGQQKFEWKWYSGDRLVKRGDAVANVGKPPHYVWNVTQPVALGVGKGHVEFLLNDQVLAKRNFEVIDTATTPTPPLPRGASS